MDRQSATFSKLQNLYRLSQPPPPHFQFTPLAALRLGAIDLLPRPAPRPPLQVIPTRNTERHFHNHMYTRHRTPASGVAMQDEAVELSSSRAVYGSSALHHLDLRGAAARLDAAAAPRGVLLDQDLREVIRGGAVGASICYERIVARGSEKAGSRHVEAAGSTEQRCSRDGCRVEISRRSGRRWV